MKQVRCAVALFIVLTIPGYAAAQGRPGGRPMSIPEQLSAIDETVRTIQSVVYQISPVVVQSVTLATSILFQRVANGRGIAHCAAVNVSDTPLHITIKMFNRNGQLVESKLASTVEARTLEGVDTRVRAGYWCEFSFSGPAGAVRAGLTIYQEVSNGEELSQIPLATTEAR
jgi:hypothetical protein